MSYFWAKYKESIVLVILVLLCLMLIGSPLNKQANVLRNFFQYLLQPSQEITTELVQDNTNLARNISALFGLREKNIDLQEQVYRMQGQLQSVRETLSENERLRAMLAYKKSASRALLAAQVIASDPANCFTSIWLNRGSEDGVKVNTVALAFQAGKIGVAGRVIEVQPQSSRLLLLTDQDSEIRVIDQRSRFDGVVTGENSNSLRLRYFLFESDLQAGDDIITSGKGGIFPAGLMIGTITKSYLEEDKLFKGGTILPEINPGLIEEVMLIIQ